MRLDKSTFAEKARIEMQKFNQYKNSENKTEYTEQIPLPDFFVFYEGFINYEWSNLPLDIESMNCYETTELVMVDYDSAAATYTISSAEIAHIFEQLEGNIFEYYEDGYDHVKLIDFSLLSIDASSEAEIEIVICMATTNYSPNPPNVFYTPDTDVWATGRQGWCPSTDFEGWDGANFVNAFANTKTYIRQNPCPPGTSLFIASGYIFDTYGLSQMIPYMYSAQELVSEIYPRVWSGPSNTCLPGNDNDFWYGLYDGVEHIMSFARDKVQSKPLTSNFEIVLVDFHSHPPGTWLFSNSAYASALGVPHSPHFHGGDIRFGFVSCN